MTDPGVCLLARDLFLDAEARRTSGGIVLLDERPSDLWAQARDRYGEPHGTWHRVRHGRRPDGTPTSRLSCNGYRWLRRLNVFVLRAFGGVERDPPPLLRCRTCLRRKDPPCPRNTGTTTPNPEPCCTAADCAR